MQAQSICRCCLANGPVKDLNTPYIWFNKEEIYSEMLNDCFNIALHTFKSGKICDVCIRTLRRSVAFKHQVLNCQQELLKNIDIVESNDEKPFLIKVEPTIDIDDSDDNCATDPVTANETPIIIKIESQLNSNKELTVKKVENIRSNALKELTIKKVENKTNNGLKELTVKKIENKRSNGLKKTTKMTGKWQTDKIKCLFTKLASKSNNPLLKIQNYHTQSDSKILLRTRSGAPKKQLPKATTKTPSSVTTKRIVMKESMVPDGKGNYIMKSQSNIENLKHKETLLTILKYSNATPFKDKTLVGYVCGYCDSTYPDPKDLRKHTEEDHAEDRLQYKSEFGYTRHNVKLDVTDLYCKICNEKMDDLKILKQHLIKSHNKTIHMDIKDLLMQFKLKKGAVYDCAMCTSTYETFKMLKQHMNKHYSNFSCNECESTFATQRSLNVHKATHVLGSFKCNFCDKIFSNKPKRAYHEKWKHLGAKNIKNCPYCNISFNNYYKRNQHLVTVHNSEAQYKCNVCDKTYFLKSLLTSHIKRSHLMERNCQCSECGVRFFSKKLLKAHMVIHTGEKNYSCEVCHKAYARKYTLREHMRIHNNDRRFKCDVCLSTFVQKCSLKSHLLSNHGITMAANEITVS